MLDGQAVAEGGGPSKKEAEQEAARLALERLKQDAPPIRRPIASQSISMMPQSFRSSSMSAAPADAMTSAGSGCWGRRGSA